ncbi:hypothetical protein HF086_009871, partial [Spodoptera exigua]
MSHTSERASKLQAETTKLPIPCVSVSNLNIKDLCTKRSSIKGRITKYKNYLNTFLEPGKTFSSTDLCSLSQRFQKFEELCTVFEDVQSEIEMLNSSNLDSELDVRDEMELDFSTLIAQTRIFLDTNQPHEAVPGGSAATCAFCGGSHRIYDCSSFLAKSVEDRQREAARLKLCINCLRKGHSPRQC